MVLQVLVLGASVGWFDWKTEAARARAGVLRGTKSMGDLTSPGEAVADEEFDMESRQAVVAASQRRRSSESKSVWGLTPHPRHGVHEPLVGVSSELTD